MPKKLEFVAVQKMFDEKNYTIICDQVYVNANNKLRYLCNIHAQIGEQEISLNSLKARLKNCKECKREEQTIRQREKYCINEEILYSSFKDREYELLEGQSYVNNRADLLYFCEKHRDKGTLKITWSNFINGKGCKYCGHKRTADSVRNKLTFKYMEEEFNKKNLTLITGQEYRTNNESLMYICKLHPDEGIQKTNWNNFSGRNKVTCKVCSHEKTAVARRKYTIEEVTEIFSNENYIMLETEFTSTSKHLSYICPNGHDGKIVLYSFISGNRCKVCYYEGRSGENSPTWKGGITEISQHLRGVISDWKLSSLKNSNYKCHITGTSKNIEIHHLVPFHSIVKDVFNQLDLPIHRTIGEYSKMELEDIDANFREIHNNNYPLGVCLNVNIHKLYHRLYGYDNSPEQFIEFTNNYKSGKLVI